MQLVKNYKFKDNEKNYKRKHYLDNQNKYRELNRIWVKNNKEKVSKYKKEYRDKNKELLKQKQKEYKIKNYRIIKIKNKIYNLKKNYNLSLEEFNKMIKLQKNKCIICKRDQKNLKKPLNVDHNHKTGKIRDLLCSRCNFAVGFYENFDMTLVKKYLDKHKRKELN